MEKRLRSSLQSSPETFLSTATNLGKNKSTKPALKTLMHSIDSSSHLSSSLPHSLNHSISLSITSFRNLLEPSSPQPHKSPRSPPSKRLRRSSRQSKKTTISEESEKQSPESKVNQEKQRIFRELKVLCHIAFLCVTNPRKAFSPENLLHGARQLHDNLRLFESDSELLSDIANLCEEWWKKELQGKETLISQSLPFLLSRSLTSKKKVDVHRVYTLREAFKLFDFEDESIEDLKLLLMRCVIMPFYLEIEEGRKFVSFMFGLSGQLLKEALAMIRAQIPFGRKLMLEAYADIIFRAWKVAEGDLKVEIETGFLQGLIEGVIHASSASFAASIRRVLGGFINQRTTDGIEKLLFRLAEPVLFRSLQVANSNVRHNALHLLLDMFPLEDPDATKEVKDTLLDKQLFLLERSLSDDCPDVRVVAVEGSCRILHLFWEIVPSLSITKLITKVFDDMSHDISNEVRLSVVNGIVYLLGNPQSHELLKVLLPRLGHLFLDPMLSVRIAVADLLLLLRDIRTFQFNKVVGLDVILYTLANDRPLVAQKITKLLIPSYFPSKVNLEEACNRCVTLIKRSPLAGARFCEFALSEGVSTKSLMQLVRVLISLVLSTDKLNDEQVEGVLLAAANLCNNLASEPSYKASLKELFLGEKVKHLIAVPASGRAQSYLFNILSNITPNDVAGLLDECLALLTTCNDLSENVERQAEVRSAHKLIMSCNWFDDAFEALTMHLQNTAFTCHIKFGTEMPKQTILRAKRKKNKSSVKISVKLKQVNGKKSQSPASLFEEDYLIAAGLAWQIKDLLITEDTRKALLRSRTLQLAFLALKVISEVSIVQCMHCEYMDTLPVLAYTSLALHMTYDGMNVSGSSSYASKMDGDLDSGCSSSKTVLDQTLDHLFICSQKLLTPEDSEKSGKMSSRPKQDNNKIVYSRGQKQKETQPDTYSLRNGETSYAEGKRLSNTVKMLATVCKFMVDAMTVRLVFHHQERCLEFVSAVAQYIISKLRQHSGDRIIFKDGSKDTFICLNSLYTYAAKLLYLALKDTSDASPPPPEVTDVAHDLLDLLTTAEVYLGSGYAARIVATVKSWLPDFVLALASARLLKHAPDERIHLNMFFSNKLPSWLSCLAKVELCEINQAHGDEEGDADSVPEEFPTFKKLVEIIVQFLRGNLAVLDSFGVILFASSVVGLENKDFGLVLGLLHFVCVKLITQELSSWGELHLMLASLQEIYPQIEREIKEPRISEDDRKKLLGSRALLEPPWLYFIYETRRDSMMED